MSPTHYRFVINGIQMNAFDQDGSLAAAVVVYELQQDSYGLSQVQFSGGDVVVDVGGHIGLFSIYLGLRFPEIVIHSFEPFPDNYELFRRNLRLNHVGNVHLHTSAISGDGRQLEMATNASNSGGATCNSKTLFHRRTKIPSRTLDQVFDDFGIKQCKLLKMDCEGSEYEILLSTHVLSRVERLCGEFHTNELLASRGYSPAKLVRHCAQYVDATKMVVRPCRMSD